MNIDDIITYIFIILGKLKFDRLNELGLTQKLLTENMLVKHEVIIFINLMFLRFSRIDIIHPESIETFI